jgi:hypothetical protein
MATNNKLQSYDLAFMAHLVLGIELMLGGLLDLSGSSALISFFAAILSLFVFLPSIIFVVPTAIVLSLFLRDIRLIFLTLLLFITFKFIFFEDGRGGAILTTAPYALASLWCAFEWFSERRKTRLVK